MADLESLVVSGTELDRKLVAQILAPYVQLDKDASNIRPTDAWGSLSQEDKIIVYLVARKAMKALSFNIPFEEASASEIVRDTGVKSGTAHPALRKLLGENILRQTDSKKYMVPAYGIPAVRARLSKGD